MLSEADAGILFCAPENVKMEFPQFVAVDDYHALAEQFVALSNREITP